MSAQEKKSGRIEPKQNRSGIVQRSRTAGFDPANESSNLSPGAWR